MKQRKPAGRRPDGPLHRRLSLLIWLATALLLALPVCADPATSSATEPAAPAASNESPTPAARSTEAPAQAGATPHPAQHAVTQNRSGFAGTPSRRSIRTQIENIDPASWLSRYGIVERRPLKP